MNNITVDNNSLEPIPISLDEHRVLLAMGFPEDHIKSAYKLCNRKDPASLCDWLLKHQKSLDKKYIAKLKAMPAPQAEGRGKGKLPAFLWA